MRTEPLAPEAGPVSPEVNSRVPEAGWTAPEAVSRWGGWALAAMVAVLVLQVLTLPALYLVDLPAWTFQAALFRAEVGASGATPWSLYMHPVPNSLGTLLPAALLSIAGPVWTGKLVAGFLLASGAGVAWMLASGVDGREAWGRASVLLATLVVSSSLWNGYLGFQIGVALALGLGAVWVRNGSLAPWLVAVGSVALFFAHAVPFAVLALLAGLHALHRRDGRQIAALVPAGILTVWYIAVRVRAPEAAFPAATDAGGLWRHLAYKGYTVLKLGPFQHPDGVSGEGILASVPWAYWLAVVASVAFVAVLGVALVVGTVRLSAGGQRRAALYGWAMVVAGCLLPPFALNVVNPGERIVVVGALILLAAVPLAPRLRAVLGVMALLFLLDDVASLEAQRPGLAPEVLAEAYEERAQREVSPAPVAPFDVTATPSPEAFPLFGHPTLLNSDRYLAAKREDWGRQSFETGLLRPTGGR